MTSEIRFSRHLLPRRHLLGRALTAALLASPPAHAAPGRPLILLDPGHGGRDPGASGGTRTLEKHVTLAAAMAVRDSLAGIGGYRVELTRDRDQFLWPEDRAGIAVARKASLFLSLHADATANRTIGGASVYTLSARASDPETEALAARENGAAMGPKRPPEVVEILNSLAQRETRAISARAASAMVRGLEAEVPLLFSPKRRANFVVLHAAGIPSVLLEMGFLSNPADEAALNDPAHRARLARALARAIDMWFARGTG